jgi:hypothetical protein
MTRTNYAEMNSPSARRKRASARLDNWEKSQRDMRGPSIHDERPDLKPSADLTSDSMMAEQAEYAAAERAAGVGSNYYRGEGRSVQDMRTQGRPNFPFDNPHYGDGSLGVESGPRGFREGRTTMGTRDQRWGYGPGGNLLDDAQDASGERSYAQQARDMGYRPRARGSARQYGGERDSGGMIRSGGKGQGSHADPEAQARIRNQQHDPKLATGARPDVPMYDPNANYQVGDEYSKGGYIHTVTERGQGYTETTKSGLPGGISVTPERPTDAKRGHMHGRKAAADARRQGFSVSWDESLNNGAGGIDDSKHDGRAEGRRIRKLHRQRMQEARRGGGAFDPSTSERIGLIRPAEMIDPEVFIEGQSYMTPTYIPPEVDEETGETIPEHYEQRRTVWQDGRMQPEPETPLSMEERAMRVREAGVELRREGQEGVQNRFDASMEFRKQQRDIAYEQYARKVIAAGGMMDEEHTKEWGGYYESYRMYAREYDAENKRISADQAEAEELGANLDLDKEQQARLDTLNALIAGKQQGLIQLQEQVNQARADLMTFQEERIKEITVEQQEETPGLNKASKQKGSFGQGKSKGDGAGGSPSSLPASDPAAMPQDGFITEDGQQAAEIEITSPRGGKTWISMARYYEQVAAKGEAEVHRVWRIPDPPKVR